MRLPKIAKHCMSLRAMAALLLAASMAPVAISAPVFVEIYADQDRNSPNPLDPFDIRFIVHANGNQIQGMAIVGQFLFSNGNIIGEIEEWPDGEAQLIYSTTSLATFDSRAWNSQYAQGNNPDTVRLGLTSFGEPWTGSGEVFRIRVHPTDTGSIVFDSLPFPIVPTEYKIEAHNPLGEVVEPLHVWSPTIHVPPQSGPVRFRISTSSGTDTLFFGVPGTIYFNVDAVGNDIAGMTFGLQ